MVIDYYILHYDALRCGLNVFPPATTPHGEPCNCAQGRHSETNERIGVTRRIKNIDSHSAMRAGDRFCAMSCTHDMQPGKRFSLRHSSTNTHWPFPPSPVHGSNLNSPIIMKSICHFTSFQVWGHATLPPGYPRNLEYIQLSK